MDERTTIKIKNDVKVELDKVIGKSINDKIKYLLSLNAKESKGMTEHRLTTALINTKLNLILEELNINESFYRWNQRRNLKAISDKIDALNEEPIKTERKKIGIFK